MKMHFKKFTIIELLMVIAIISILASVLIPSLNKARDMSKKISCLSNHKQIGTALLSYLGDSNDWWIYENYDSSTYPLSYWNGLATSYGYLPLATPVTSPKHGVTKLFCPTSLQGKLDNNYSINAVASSWIPGGGLASTNAGIGCKNNNIKYPSAFITVADRFYSTGNNPGPRFVYLNTGTTTSYAQFPRREQKNEHVTCEASADPYLHNDGGNYLFADGHAAWMKWSDINLSYLSVLKNGTNTKLY